MGKRKHKQGKSDRPHKMKRSTTNSSEASVKSDAAEAMAVHCEDAAATAATVAGEGVAKIPKLTNQTSRCFSKRGPRKGASFFHIPDVQDIALCGMGFGTFRKPVSCDMSNAEAIPKVAMVMLSSMTTALYARVGANMPKCSAFLSGNSYPFLTPGKSMFVKQDVASAFLEVKINPRERKLVEDVLPPTMLKVYSAADPLSFTLSLKDMAWSKYPLRSEWHIKETGAYYQSDLLRDHFFFIPDRETAQTAGESSDSASSATATATSESSCQRRGKPTPGDAAAAASGDDDGEEETAPADHRPMFAIDCEMCKTEAEYALTRISVVDEQLKCVYQTLVKPEDPIVDYVTTFSGITESMLRDVTTTVEDVQQKLAEIIPHNAVLVGHSLENDLMALKMTHRYIIDTSVLFSEGGVKQKLRKLARNILRVSIQEDDSGHDPTEDAVAAMRLAKFFLEEGHKNTKFTPGVSLFALADVCKKRGSVIDLPAACSKHCRGEAQGYPVFDDDEATKKAIKALPTTDVLWLRLSNVRRYLSVHGPLDWDKVSELDELKDEVSSIDNNLFSLYSALPEHTLLMVLFDHGDIRELSKHKQAHPNDVEGYEAKVKRCRTSMFFSCLKDDAIASSSAASASA